MRKTVCLLLCAALLLLAACSAGGGAPVSSTAPASSGAPPAEALPETKMWTGWVPYWDYESALLEMAAYAQPPAQVVAFAALFGPNDALLMLEPADEMARALSGALVPGQRMFLSFTNDVQQEDGSFLQKDTEVLRRLFATPESIKAHVDEILALTAQYGAGGIEIDYENIKKDKALWAQFVQFIEALMPAAEAAGLPLRVVLGWNSVDYADFPAGPSYVVMCYNLHGSHSSAGPKADTDFLQKAYKKNTALPGEVDMAFANGGYDWGSDDSVRALTQMAAQELAAEHAAVPQRDEGSAALRFTYTDAETNAKHEVWYADGETLEAWGRLAKEHGYLRFSTWRLGGNDAQSLAVL